jgi:hypothetical protein
MPAAPTTVLYDDPTMQISIRLPSDRAGRIKARRKLSRALDKAFSAFEAVAREHLPDGCHIDVARRRGATIVERRINRQRSAAHS